MVSNVPGTQEIRTFSYLNYSHFLDMFVLFKLVHVPNNNTFHWERPATRNTMSCSDDMCSVDNCPSTSTEFKITLSDFKGKAGGENCCRHYAVIKLIFLEQNDEPTLRLLKALEFSFQPSVGSAYCDVTQK